MKYKTVKVYYRWSELNKYYDKGWLVDKITQFSSFVTYVTLKKKKK